MTQNWQQLAEGYQDQYLADLKALIAIPSVRDDDNATDEYPLGEGPAKALQQFLAFGERDGFVTKNLDNLAGYIEYGDGDETFAILSHVDVMPAGAGWDTDPFQLTIKDGIAYGRGTSDDKGPGLAAYYGLKMMKDANIKPNVKIRLILGTDEESQWTGMTHYFETEPAPTFGFSPDAEFPLINGEKGMASFETTFAGTNGNGMQLISFESGLRENMVPRDAVATIKTNDAETISERFEDFVVANPIEGDSEMKDGQITLHVIGKAAHGMEPKNGINSGTYLATFLNGLELEAGAKEFINFIAQYLHDDSRDHKLGVNYTDEIMGDLTMNVGIMKFDQTNGGFVNTNFRYPKGIGPKEIQAALVQKVGDLNGSVKQISEKVPHYVDPEDPIVQTLMNVYREQTGVSDAQPEVVGGGTYGRLMERGVAFGALFPWTEDSMHQANEFQPVADLVKAMAIYGQSIHDLALQ